MAGVNRSVSAAREPTSSRQTTTPTSMLTVIKGKKERKQNGPRLNADTILTQFACTDVEQLCI